MPGHVPRPRHNPPNMVDRLEIHTADTGIAALLTTPVAIMVLLTPFLPGYEPSNSLSTMSAVLSLCMAGMLGVGGILATLGLFWKGRVVSIGWTLEQCGWLFIAGGWGGFGYMAWDRSPWTIIAWYIPCVLALIALARVLVVARIERDTRPRAEEIKHERECGGST